MAFSMYWKKKASAASASRLWHRDFLTDKYLKGIPKDSRAAKPYGFLKREQITEAVVKKVAALNELAKTTRPVACPDGPCLGTAG